MKVCLFVSGQPELQVLGCGHRTVTVQLRSKTVLLHHNGSAAKMKRVAFKEMLLLNQQYRKRNGLKPRRPTKLELVVSNPSASQPLTEAA